MTTQANSPQFGAGGVVIRNFAAERRARREAQKRMREFELAGVWAGSYVTCGKCGKTGCTLYTRNKPKRLIVTCPCGARAEFLRKPLPPFISPLLSSNGSK